MVLRVVQWSTGNVGQKALRAIIDSPRLELVGVHAHNVHKIGVDAAKLCGLDEPTGILATDDIDALIALRPDCLSYSTLAPDVDVMCRFLEAGVNISGTAGFITGEHLGTDALQRLEKACLAGGASLYGSGLNPGLSNILALVASSVCDRIYSVSVTESVDVTDYASKETWEALGWARPLGAEGQNAATLERTSELREAMEMTANGLGIEIDDVKFEVEYAVTKEEIVLPYMTYPAGTVAGQRSTYHGMKNGRSVVRQHICYRVQGSLEPEFPLVHGYLVEIEGEPSAEVLLTFPKPHVEGVNRERKAMASGMVATAMPAVNAIPAVCAAPTGIRHAYELPIITAFGVEYTPPAH
ncbi:NAD(P)H-dependent amine dehydrogenase family protein [Mycobacterium sp. MUNTM1]